MVPFSLLPSPFSLMNVRTVQYLHSTYMYYYYYINNQKIKKNESNKNSFRKKSNRKDKQYIT